MDEFGDLTITASGNDASVAYGSGDAITVTGVASTDLTEDDFSFG